MRRELEVLSTIKIKKADDVYKIVDSLNRTLKDHGLLFGLSLDDNDSETMVFTIYRT